MIKTRRLEYVFDKTRQAEEKLSRLNINFNDPGALSISERADIELVNELRFWTVKYMNMSNLLGANIGFFTYRFLHLSLHWYIAAPLAFSVYFVSRNILMRNTMDGIYYSSHDVFLKYKDELERIKKQKEAAKALTAENKETAKVSKEDRAKQEIQRIRRQNLIIEEQAK